MANKQSKEMAPLISDMERLWQKAKDTGMPRRRFLALLAAGGAAAVLTACGTEPSPNPTSTPSRIDEPTAILDTET